MNSRGGCCIARYAGGGAYDTSKVDRIMLRFRPIAPKPATGASSSSSSSSSASGSQNTDLYSKPVRTKRKQTNNKKPRHNRKRKSSSCEEDNRDDSVVVTLPLLPETPDRKDWYPVEQHVASTNVPMWLNFGESEDRTVVMPQTGKVMMGSCVTVECVTDTWMDVNGLGGTDNEKRMNLERDTCPGFISDGYGRVTWTNEAYRKMVGQDDIMVWLMMKEEVPVTVKMLTYRAFTCRVRLQYTCGKERSSLTLPCDVWRMDCAGFAWRLDVKAALCLGR